MNQKPPDGYLELVRAGRVATSRLDTARRWVKHYEAEFAKGSNPVYVWEAIAECLEARLLFPSWVLEYLHDVASGISAMSRDRIPAARSIDRSVAAALRLRGSGGFNPFKALHHPAHEIGIAFEVYERQRSHRADKWATVFADVASEHHKKCEQCSVPISVSTVKRAWHEHAKVVIPPHVITRSKSQRLSDILRQQ